MRVPNLVICILGFASTLAVAQPVVHTGRVVSVADGDTSRVELSNKSRIRIRLQGIDAPERTQPYSQVSRRHLHELVGGKEISFVPEKLDRHGRTVAVVRLKDGTDVCLAQIEAGLAWHYKKYELEQTPDDRARYAAAEVMARAAQRGLWRSETPMEPWEFRALRREEEH